jgi:Mn2+/Fe2+ NRAMP family transporter
MLLDVVVILGLIALAILFVVALLMVAGAAVGNDHEHPSGGSE